MVALECPSKEAVTTRWYQLDLLSAIAHPPHIRRHRAEVISRRVQSISGLFAILTLLWIVIDLVVFPWPLWGVLVGLRLTSAAAFAALAYPKRNVGSMGRALGMMAAMLAIPPSFYLIAHPFIAAAELDTIARLFASGYALLPFVVVAGMSVFPLTLLEVLAAAVPVILATIAVNISAVTAEELVRMVWLLFLVMGIAAFSGVSQLHYMITLVNQTSRDVLTGAFTRRSGEEALALHFRIAVRTSVPLSVMFIDLDDFKPINDGYGHEAGDAALRSAAQHLRLVLRRSDMLIRWGGEEFVVLLPNTDEAGLAIVLRRLFQSGLGNRPDGRPLTASIGLAERLQDGTLDWDQLVRIADERMYTAKTSGKNRAVGIGDVVQT